MKMLIFTYWLGGGGVQRVISNIVKYIDRSEFDISIALARKEGRYLDDIIKQGIEIVDLKAKKVHFSWVPLNRVLRNQEPDILFCCPRTINIAGILSTLFCRKKPKIIIRQDLDINKRSNSKVLLNLMKIFYKKADAIIALSNDMKQNLMTYLKLPSNKIHVIYNAIDVEIISQLSQESVIEQHFQNDRPKIITLGRLTRQKNYFLLIEAFKLLKGELDADLIILGEGPQRNELQSFADRLGVAKNVFFLGHIINPYKYMCKSNVYALTSDYEGLSNAMLEALACGLPVVTTDNPDNIIKNNINGFFVIRKPEDIAQKILHLLRDEALREKIKNNNLEFSRQFSITKMVKAYQDLFFFVHTKTSVIRDSAKS